MLLGRTHVFSVRHAHSVLYDLLPTLYLLHDSQQFPRVLGHFVCEGADAVGHVQDGRADLIGLGFQNGVLGEAFMQQVSIQFCLFLHEKESRLRYLVSLVLAVLLAHAAHEWARLTRLLKADKLNGVDLVLRAQGLLVGLVSQGHPSVFGQRAG